MQAFHDRRILGRDAIPERLRAVRGWNARCVKQILAAPRDTVQWPTVFTRADLFVGLPGLPEREFARERDDASQLRIAAVKPLQVEVREPL